MSTKKKPSGEYIIYREEPDKDGSRIVYSTNSIFWYCFFTDRPLPGSEIGPGVKIGEKIDWSIVTHEGKIVHRFSQKSAKSQPSGGV
jgi:hypothetical protein